MLDMRQALIVGFVAGALAGSILFGFLGSIRVTAIKQEFTEYKQTQTTLYNKAVSDSLTRLEETRNDFLVKEAVLKEQIKSNAPVERARSVGKLYVKPSCSTGAPVQAPTGTNEASPNPVSTPGKPAEEREESYQVVNDCAITTLMLNELQMDIEKQLSKGSE